MIERIGRYFGDRPFRRIRIPRQIAQREMARMIDHEALLRRSAANFGRQQAFSLPRRP
jgi:hypothetical protein